MTCDTEKRGRWLATCIALLVSASFPGCKCGGDKGGDEDTSTDTDEEPHTPPPCYNPCPDNAGRDRCECTVKNFHGPNLDESFDFTVCYDDEYLDNLAALQLACLEENYKFNESYPNIETVWYCRERSPCSGSSDPTTGEPTACSGWDPANDISLVSGVYRVDGNLVSTVVNDPTILGLCEEFGASILSTGAVQLNGLDAGELLYELGLRSGDVLVELNGMPMTSFDECIEAYWELFVDQGETSYELDILRGGNPLTLNYLILWTSP